jgi:DNA-binding response OmpR family regulator
MLRFESDVPIIILSTYQGEADRIRGLDLGADDYVIKPFLLGELLARIRARLRRSDPGYSLPKHEVLTSGELRVDVGGHRVFAGDQEIDLVPKEFDLLVCLMRNRGQPLSREMLLRRVWGHQHKSSPRTIDVHIRWLRSKIDPDVAQPRYIETVRGHGYRFVDSIGQPPVRPANTTA